MWKSPLQSHTTSNQTLLEAGELLKNQMPAVLKFVHVNSKEL